MSSKSNFKNLPSRDNSERTLDFDPFSKPALAPQPTTEREAVPATPIAKPIVTTVAPNSAKAPSQKLVITPVDTSEKPTSRSFSMYNSQHEQLHDLSYIEGRYPWQIISQALIEYTEKHHGIKKLD